ncbi:MAG: hypothetical protein ACPGYL_06000, partial [Rhodospirillaceae bacterium]
MTLPIRMASPPDSDRATELGAFDGFAQPARFATFPQRSRGRLLPEPGLTTRSEFQRDRDRIIHSTAFRRLKHKTQ